MTKMIFYAGAHKGEEIEACIRNGYDKIVAIEPQNELCIAIKESFPDITVVNAALWKNSGEREMYYGGYSTLATLLKKRTREDKFKGYGWNHKTMVKTITLDTIIEEHGIPETICMDIEGSEKYALVGLSHPVEVIKFEYDMAFFDDALECVNLVERLARYRYIIRSGESTVIEKDADIDRIILILLALRNEDTWGMIEATKQEPQ